MTEIPPVGLSKKGGRYNGQFKPEFSRLYEDPDLLLVTPLPVRYIVAVIGRRWSGKSATVTTLHEELGFDNHSLTDIVRATAEERGLDPGNRRVLQSVADSLRVEHREPGIEGSEKGDAAYLARRMLRRIHDRYVHHSRNLAPPRRVVLSGFGHPDELGVFLSLPNFRMIRLVCGKELREKRAVNGRARADADAFGLRVKDPKQAFTEVDRVDRDGKLVNEWAGECAHSTAAVLGRLEGLASERGSGADELDPENLVYDLDSGASSADQRERLEQISRLLDRRFRIL